MRAYYSAPILQFLCENTEFILGTLTKNSQFDVDLSTRFAWTKQIDMLRIGLSGFEEGHILFEYSIPRMGKRVDNIILLNGIIFVLEFKVGDNTFSATAIDQVIDYALDLKYFHENSTEEIIIPIVVATEAGAIQQKLNPYSDQVYAPLKANNSNLGSLIRSVISNISGPTIDPNEWLNSAYKPTPTIIEAAQTLYRTHSVEDISRSDASAINLTRTADAIIRIINTAKSEQKKFIVFVTGVPGAGKTLAGLNIANQRQNAAEGEHAVFLSGNGPLVKVLREALIRDKKANLKPLSGTHLTKKDIAREVEPFIQNIHRFRDEALESNRPPHEKIAIFDEAQRAWTLEQTASFMKRKRNKVNFEMSEPQFLISYMDRHENWAVIICLVGGGQEINTGEAGLLEWFRALKHHFPEWHVSFSPNLTDSEYTDGENIFNYFSDKQVIVDKNLHLSVSIRSFRAEKVSALVKAILDINNNLAKELYSQVDKRYPIVLTRDVVKAREWLRSKARGTERIGLLASSGGLRLRPIGLNVEAEIEVEQWFLNGKDDVRSSYYLEEVATEFDVQGLELDWSCIAWDADLRYSDGNWASLNFSGSRWQVVRNQDRRRYLKNAYRVLLTRARQGMVILIPYGDKQDYTRKPEYYDGTYEYLKSIGLEVI
jgi:hypothetical protein